MSLALDLWVRFSQAKGGFADLPDVTLADEDTNAIPIDTANKAIQGNVKSNIGQWTAFSNTH